MVSLSEENCVANEEKEGHEASPSGSPGWSPWVSSQEVGVGKLLVSIDRGPKFLLYKNSKRPFGRRKWAGCSL
jgi:hypothetical protein